MPKNSSAEILSRWREMDYWLARSPGLEVEWFARRKKVSTKTVLRDLKAFRELGQAAELHVDRTREVGVHHWRYADGVRPLFVANILRDGPE